MNENWADYFERILSPLPKRDFKFYIEKDVFDYDKLDLNISTMSSESRNISDSKRKLLTEEWKRLLPKLKNIREMRLSHKVNQSFFESICQMENLEFLEIKWSSIKNIEAIIGLRKLRHLDIGSSTQIENINSLAKLRTLSSLAIENFKLMKKIDPICELTQLISLQISGSVWTTQSVETLRPISRLKNLRRLILTNLKVRDKSLRPVGDLKNLKVFQTALWWPKSEFEYLYHQLPNLTDSVVLKVKNDPEFCKEFKIR